MDVKHIEAFGDSLLVMQKIADTFQCLNGSLNAYLDKCLKIITLFDDFTMQHVSSDENTVANDLVQQASGFRANQGQFGFLEKLDVSVCQIGQTDFQPVHSARIYCAESNSTEPDNLVSETGGSKISRTLGETSKTTMTSPDDWRTSVVCYLENPYHNTDRKVQWQALKDVMLDNTLYR
jgi:hypothetical protein